MDEDDDDDEGGFEGMAPPDGGDGFGGLDLMPPGMAPAHNAMSPLEQLRHHPQFNALREVIFSCLFLQHTGHFLTRSLPRCLPLSFCLHTFDEIATALPCAAPLLLDHAWLFLAHNCIVLTFGAALLRR